jgi:squalene-hopene/tetraprenyl-beta-curcumene cyclase
LENVSKRVRLWNEVGPYYSDEKDGINKTAESRGSEAVLNSLILATRDARANVLDNDTRAAFANMWALQQADGEMKGAWRWLDFGLRPWEASESVYWGATLAALAVGTAPAGYRSTLTIQSNLELLRAYLTRAYTQQSLYNRTALLWASSKWPELLNQEKRESLIREILEQQREDGGWSLPLLNKKPQSSSTLEVADSPNTISEVKSDGVATGFVVLVLQQVGMSRTDSPIHRGLSWLTVNQDRATGAWPGYSLNRRRNPATDIGRFMSDAATAYSILALTHAGEH